MKTILLVDDSPDTLYVEEMVLTSAGYVVHTASDGSDALLKIKNLQNIDLILLDYEMDGMNGPEFLVAFKKQFPETHRKTPVVILTAHENPKLELGQGWIQKMNDLDQFLAAVAQFINSHPVELTL